MMLRTILADDEPLARQRLRELITATSWLDLVGEAVDGPSTVTLIDQQLPALAFVDIKMPGLSGLDVLSRIAHRPHVVFTTAYDNHAVTAFELQAVDYLLKPFGPERFTRAAERARDLAALADGSTSPPDPADEVLTRIFVRDRGRVFPVSLDKVSWLEGLDDYVVVHAEGRRHLVGTRLHEFEARLDPRRFVRVHRSHIVNLDFVHTLERLDGGRARLHLNDGVTVAASRSGSRRLRELDAFRS